MQLKVKSALTVTMLTAMSAAAGFSSFDFRWLSFFW